jgi:hypothetical protein
LPARENSASCDCVNDLIVFEVDDEVRVLPARDRRVAHGCTACLGRTIGRFHALHGHAAVWPLRHHLSALLQPVDQQHVGRRQWAETCQHQDCRQFPDRHFSDWVVKHGHLSLNNRKYSIWVVRVIPCGAGFAGWFTVLPHQAPQAVSGGPQVAAVV